MSTIAYIANHLPAVTEPYVIEEIQELRRRGMRLVPCSAWAPDSLRSNGTGRKDLADILSIQPVSICKMALALWYCVRNVSKISDLLRQACIKGKEPLRRRAAALVHTWLGAYFALMLRPYHIDHIHVHHGFFASWIAMVAARLLGITYSMTLHGSDLLLHGFFMDAKLRHCKFCVTISEFNRQFIVKNYPEVASKVLVQRMGVEAPDLGTSNLQSTDHNTLLVMLSVGRLHAVKDHAFLVQACSQLKSKGLAFVCLIAGEGPEHNALTQLVSDLDLRGHVRLLGHVPRHELTGYYTLSDVVVLTSRSEGIPITLMEAMSHAKPVLAPSITGIPELVSDGKTGFLYSPGSLEDFVRNVDMISRSRSALGPVGRAARRHVLEHFHREKNLAAFCDQFVAQFPTSPECMSHARPLLQQI